MAEKRPCLTFFSSFPCASQQSSEGFYCFLSCSPAISWGKLLYRWRWASLSFWQFFFLYFAFCAVSFLSFFLPKSSFTSDCISRSELLFCISILSVFNSIIFCLSYFQHDKNPPKYYWCKCAKFLQTKRATVDGVIGGDLVCQLKVDFSLGSSTHSETNLNFEEKIVMAIRRGMRAKN